MNLNLMNSEKVLILNSIKEIRYKIERLELRIEKIVLNTPFNDSLSNSFYGGKVGFMSIKASLKKQNEIEKSIEIFKNKKSITTEISALNNKLKKLNTGNYLIRKNGLLVDSYKILIEKKDAFDKVKKTKVLKGSELSNEDFKICMELRKENLTALNKREKSYKIS